MRDVISISTPNPLYHFLVDLSGTAPKITLKAGLLKDIDYHLTDEALESLKTNPKALPVSLDKKGIFPVAIAPLDDKRIVVVHFDQEINRLKAVWINYSKGYFGEIESETCFPASQRVDSLWLGEPISFRAGRILTPVTFIFKNASNLFFQNDERTIVLADPTTGKFKAEVNFGDKIRGMTLDADGNLCILVRKDGNFSLYKFTEVEFINFFTKMGDLSKVRHLVLNDMPGVLFQMCFLKTFDFALSTYDPESEIDVIYRYDKKGRPIERRMLRHEHTFMLSANPESQSYNIQLAEDKSIPYEIINYHHLEDAIEKIPRIKKLLSNFQKKIDSEPNDKFKVLAQKLHDKLVKQINGFENNTQLSSDAFRVLESDLEKTIRVALPKFNGSPTWSAFILNFFKAISNSVMSAFGCSEKSHFTLFRPPIKKTIDEFKDDFDHLAYPAGPDQ